MNHFRNPIEDCDSFSEGTEHTVGGDREAIKDNDFIGFKDSQQERIELVKLANNVPLTS